MDTLQRIDLISETIQQAIDRGVRSVEQIHQSVAALPFDALARSGVYGDRHWRLRRRQERTIGAIYQAVRRINAEVGRFVSNQIENVEDGRALAARLRSQVLGERRDD